MKNPILVCVLLILAIVIGLILNSNKSDEATAPPATQSETNETSETPNSDDDTPLISALTITYTDSGFSPGNSTIKSGESITIRNDSSSQLDFASDEHPSHRDNSELNIGIIPAGESKTFTLNRTGSWGYHNHLDDRRSGNITVQ